MKSVCFVMPYFGKFKDSIALYLESVRRNADIDWIIVTDNDKPLDLPENVKWIKTTLQDVEAKIIKKLNCQVRLKKAYKLCDLRPFYGLIFEEYLYGYKFWGYGDFDVIYGDLFGFLKKIEDWCNYDKINRWGHCTLIKNNDEMKRFPFAQDKKIVEQIAFMLNSDRNFGFDERMYNDICFASKKRVYMGPFSADIDAFYERMRCVDKKTMKKLCKVQNVKFAPTNFRNQIFVLLRGKVYRFFIKNAKICREEFGYIHFRREVPIYLSDKSNDTFIISRSGFFGVNENELNDKSKLYILIKKYNPNKTFIGERLEYSFLGKKLLDFYGKSILLKKILKKIRRR